MKTNNNFYIATCFFFLISLVLSFNAFSNNATSKKHFKATISTPTNEVAEILNKELKQYDLIDLDVNALYDFASKQEGYFDFTLEIENSYKWDISLVMNDIRSVDHKVIIHNEDGHFIQKEKRSTTYEGSLSNNENHSVRMSIYENMLICMFNIDGERTYIQPLLTFSSKLSTNQFVVFSDKNIISSNRECASTFHQTQNKIKSIENQIEEFKTANQTYTSGCLDVAIEADFEFCNNFGSYSAVYIDAVINNANDLYVSTFNTQIKRTQMGLWHSIFLASATDATEDPYTSTKGETMLGEMQSWIAFAEGLNGTTVKRDIMVIFTGKNIWEFDDSGNVNFGVDGIAYERVICQNLPFSLAAVEAFNINFERIWTVFAHEIGHAIGHNNHSATDLMAPDLDNSTTFSTFSTNRIQDYLDDHGNGCLSCCGSARLINPLQRNTLQELIVFSNEELFYNVRDLQEWYIDNEESILSVFTDKSNSAYKAIQQELNKIKKSLVIKFYLSFVKGEEIIVDRNDIQLLDNLISEFIKVESDEKTITYLTQVKSILPVMLDKELQSALIDFDIADIEEAADYRLVQEENATQFQLIQPLDAEPALKFNIATNGDLQVQLFDLSGRALKTVVNKAFTVGEYQTAIDMQTLPSGIYVIDALFNDGTNQTHFSTKVINKTIGFSN